MKTLQQAFDLVKLALGSPWKLVGLITIMFQLPFVGFLYLEREAIAQHLFKQPTKYVLDKQAHKDLKLSLLAQTEGIVIILWEVDLSRNVRITEDFYSKSYNDVSALVGNRAPMFTQEGNENKLVLRLLNGEAFCSDLYPTSKIGEVLVRNGVTYICRAPIISPDELLIGYITVGFPAKLKNGYEIDTLVQLRSHARELVGKAK